MKYVKSILLIITVSLLGTVLQHAIALTNLAMLYILVVVITAIKWGRGPSLACAILSVLIFDFFFVPPRFSLTVAHTQYLISFGTLFTVGLVISTLALKAKEKAETARNREAQTTALYALSKDLVKTIELKALMDLAISHVSRTFGAEAAIFAESETGLDVRAASAGFPLGDADRSAALLCFQSGKPAGRTTQDMPSAEAHYLPLKTTGRVYGILGIKYNLGENAAVEHNPLLETFANQIAFAMERLRLAEEAQKAGLLREAEKLQTAFLNSLSHDLRTPLASISGSLSGLLNNPNLTEGDQKILLETASEETDRLNQLVGDLLDMARLESGALRIQKKPSEVKDLIGTALKSLDKILRGFRLSISIPDHLAEVDIDFPLVLRVMTNILDNAAKYSGAARNIDISAEEEGDFIVISIADRGIGIPMGELNQVFDKFHRVRRLQGSEGTGLGLSVSKGIVEAHGGRIWAENRPGGGTVMKIGLPLAKDGRNG